jgi:hypothetical protein
MYKLLLYINKFGIPQVQEYEIKLRRTYQIVETDRKFDLLVRQTLVVIVFYHITCDALSKVVSHSVHRSSSTVTKQTITY